MNALTRICAAIAVSTALHACLFVIRIDAPLPEAPHAITVALRNAHRQTAQPSASEVPKPPSPPPPSSGTSAPPKEPAPPRPASHSRRQIPRPEAKKRDERPLRSQQERENAPETPKTAVSTATAAATGTGTRTPAAAMSAPHGDGGVSTPQAGGPSGILDVSSLSITRRVVPEYPVISRRRRDEGTAVVVVTIETGRVTSAVLERSSGSGALDSAAVAAARGWRFDSSSGVLRARIPFVFKLR